MTARHHHYIPQCYLKGFTKGGGKKSKLVVIDFKGRKHFETIPRNVGGQRDFNRVDIDGLDQNVLETAMAEFEGHVATAIRHLAEGAEFNGEIRELILNLVALLALRSPERREHWRRFQADVAERVMDLALATEERWESQMRQMVESGETVSDVSYEDIKKFHEEKAYTIELAREHHIRMEFFGLEAILPALFGRNWMVIKTTEESGPLITSDNPVNLTWNEPEKIPPVYRSSPGFGLRSTQVYFPVTKGIAILGEFDGSTDVIEASPELVSALNARHLHFVHKHVYAPKLRFTFHDKSGETHYGNQLLQHIVA